MRRHLLTTVVMTVALFGALLAWRGPEPASSFAADAKPAAKDDEGLRKSLQKYTDAFNKGDVEALMGCWTSDPEFVDDNGKATRGREAIAALFKKSFEEHKGLNLKIRVKSTRYVTPTVAVQDGMVTVKAPDGFTDTGPFTVIWVKQDGKWLVNRVQDLPDQAGATVTSNTEALKQLDWLLGDWESEGKETRVTFTCAWTKNKNFLSIEQTIHLKDQEAMTLSQIVGWDPRQQKLRSWVFDSRGGFGEGLWTRDGNEWVVDSTGTLSDGRLASSRSSWKFVDDKTCEWLSVDREIDGRPVADIKVKYVRKAAKD